MKFSIIDLFKFDRKWKTRYNGRLWKTKSFRPDAIKYINLYVHFTVTKVKEGAVATPLIDTGYEGAFIAPKLQSCTKIDYYVTRYLERHTADYAPFIRTRLAIARSVFNNNLNIKSHIVNSITAKCPYSDYIVLTLRSCKLQTECS